MQKSEGTLSDLNTREMIMLWPLAVIVFLLGVVPQYLIQYIAPYSRKIAAQLIQIAQTL